MSQCPILIERENGIGWVRINRPDRLNAFSGTMREDLEACLAEFEDDAAVRCVVITGNGRAFSTGGDITVMSEVIAAEDIARFEHLVRAGAAIVRRINAMSKPVIAAVNGPAAGAGACLALACDVRIAAEGASIGFTFTRVGLHPDWGGSYFLPRIVGDAAALELIYTGGMIGADRCESLGLFNRIVPAAELESSVRALAGQIAAGPQSVIAAARYVNRGRHAAELDEVLELEVQAQLVAFKSSNFREGITAFLEKRTPRFNAANGGTGAA
ncbi:MAG: enoyl-CoA hydratase-related protein [Longimicrobiales bacterium]